MKKIILAVICFSALALGMQAGAQELTWSACTPAQIGPYGDIVRVQVVGCNVDPSGKKSGWMTLAPDNIDAVNQMMAVILTAMTVNKPVAIGFVSGSTDMEGYNIVHALIFNNKQFEPPSDFDIPINSQ
ncbi:MAG: hypothetical protein WC952_16900 [Desulfobulbaceae bacterium]